MWCGTSRQDPDQLLVQGTHDYGVDTAIGCNDKTE